LWTIINNYWNTVERRRVNIESFTMEADIETYYAKIKDSLMV